MIVRILGEGQFDVDDAQIEALNELDDKVEEAVGAGDEGVFRTSLEALLSAVRSAGTPVDADQLVNSELILPMADATLAEVKDLLSGDGLIPG